MQPIMPFVVAVRIRRSDGVRVRRYLAELRGTLCLLTREQTAAKRFDVYGAEKAVKDLRGYPYHFNAVRVQLRRRKVAA